MFGAALGAIGSIASGLGQASALSSFSDDISAALDVKKIARDNGFNLRDVFGKKPKLKNFRFQPKHMTEFSNRLGDYAAGKGSDNANALSAKLNKGNLDELDKAMDRQFGNDGSFARSRDLASQNTEDMLAGKVSMSTRRQLGRRAVSSGASGIGPDAVNDTYAGYLGLTTEDITTRGAEQYRSLYGGYNQAARLTTGFDAMNYTSPTMAQGLDTYMRSAENTYSAMVNKALVKASPDPMASGLVQAEMQRMAAVAGADLQASSAMSSAIGGGLQQMGGLFSGGSSAGFGGGSMGGY